MKLEIFAEDKPAEKVFEYKLEVAENVLLLSTAMISGAIALAGLCSALKESMTESGTEIGHSLEFDFVVPPPHS